MLSSSTHLALRSAEQGARLSAEVLYRHAEQARRCHDDARALRLAQDAAHAEQRADRYREQRREVV